MSECTYCPPNTKQCAHFDGHWVRLVNPGADSTGHDIGVPAVARNFCIPGETWYHVETVTVYFHSPTTLTNAEEWFQEMNVEMRKIASGSPGDECT